MNYPRQEDVIFKGDKAMESLAREVQEIFGNIGRANVSNDFYFSDKSPYEKLKMIHNLSQNREEDFRKITDNISLDDLTINYSSVGKYIFEHCSLSLEDFALDYGVSEEEMDSITRYYFEIYQRCLNKGW